MGKVRELFYDLEFELGKLRKDRRGVCQEARYYDEETGAQMFNTTYKIILPETFDPNKEEDLQTLCHELNHYILKKVLNPLFEWEAGGYNIDFVIDLENCFDCKKRDGILCTYFKVPIFKPLEVPREVGSQ